jgi:hypothetical protein
LNSYDAESSYYKNIPSRLNPRMAVPKPKRTSNLDDKNNYFESSSDVSILDDSFGLDDGSSNDLLNALLIDKKPRTPMDRIDVSVLLLYMFLLTSNIIIDIIETSSSFVLHMFL